MGAETHLVDGIEQEEHLPPELLQGEKKANQVSTCTVSLTHK